MSGSYTASALAEILDVTERTVQRWAKKQAWDSERKPGQGNGRTLLTGSMPPDIQNAIRLHEAKQQQQSGQALICLANPGKEIPEKARAIGLARLQLLTDWQKFRAKAKKKKKADAAYLAAYNAGASHLDIYKVLGKTSRASLFRWARQLKDADGDVRALCDHRGWAQATGEIKISEEAQQALLKIYLSPQRPSIALSYRAMGAAMEEQGGAIPSRRTAYRYLEKYTAENHDHVVLMRDGEKALADLVGPYNDRNDKILEVGDVLFADGHVLNFDVLHPTTGKPARLILILWFDWASRMPVGWEIMPTENTISIASALKMAIENLGKVPKVVYIDNGKAFRAKYFSRTTSGEWKQANLGLYHRLGIAIQHSKSYVARTKNVERFFGTFDGQCQKLLPSYRGASIDGKPAYLLRNEKYHTKKHGNHAEATPDIHQAKEIIQAYFGWYAQEPHDGLNGVRPIDVFTAGRGPGVDGKWLHQEFMWRKKLNPRNCRVRLAGIDYESDALYGLDQPIHAYFTWNNLSEIHLYASTDRRYLGVARPVAALHPVARHLGTEFDLLEVKEANKRQARLKKQTMELARETDASPEIINALPHIALANQRVPIETPANKRPCRVDIPEPSPEECRRIEVAQAEWEKRKALEPPYERPDFNRPLARYEHLFKLKTFQGVELIYEDAHFMDQYEAGPEYKITHRRFDQLQKLHQAQQEEA